jgi:hypothetical protein
MNTPKWGENKSEKKSEKKHKKKKNGKFPTLKE